MRRFLAAFLSLVMLMGCFFGLAGCASNNQDTLVVGQWLSMINEAFGMQDYTSDKPYFSNVTTDNPYFKAVQIAAEWEIVEQDRDIDVTKPLTWEDALLSLVNAGSFVSSSATAEEKIDYAIAHFDSSIREYWMNRTISADQAMLLLATAQEQWANREYTEKVEETKYAEGVLDFTQEANLVDEYAVKDGQIIIPISENAGIKEGDVFVLPANENTLADNAHKAKSVVCDESYMYVTVDDDIDLYDIAEEIAVEETLKPDEENTVILDGNGNILSEGSAVVPQAGLSTGHKAGTLLGPPAGTNIVKTKFSNAHTFTVNGWEVELKYNLDGKFDLAATVKTPNLLDVDKQSNKELKGSVALSVSDLKVTNKIDYKWFKLREASLRVDYSSSASVSLTYKDAPFDKVLAPKLSNGNGKYLTNLKNSVLKDKKAKGNGAKTIKLCSVNIYSIGVARVCLDVNLRVGVEGSVSVSITEHGTKGLEYKNNKLRSINVSDKDVDAQVKAKIEGTFGIGPALYTVGLKKPILGVQATIGAGAKFTYTLHLADSENHLLEESKSSDILPEADGVLETMDLYAEEEAIKAIAEAQGCTYVKETSGDVKLHIDRCADITVYFILKLELTDTSYAAELLGGKIKVSWEIFSDKNAKLMNIHCENGDWLKAFANIAFGKEANDNRCTLTYTPFDSQAAEESSESDTESGENNTILQGDSIILSEIKATLSPGDKYYIAVSQVPKGYTLDDLTCYSSNKDVIDIDSNGVAVAKAEGSSVLTVATTDGKFKAYCAVTVVGVTMAAHDSPFDIVYLSFSV